MGEHRQHMLRAIELAKQAQGFTSPNPMVGCVLVKQGRVIGEGWHKGPGALHAEAEAIRLASEDTTGACCYVTLEPCNHFGSNPPCTHALVNAGISKVVFAVADPNPLAAGGGTYLQAQGIEVESGLCAEEAEQLNRFFLHFQRQQRPYVMAKFAASLDGKITTSTGESQWITNQASRQRGHELRHQACAILVGVETVIADNPSLTARKVDCATPNHPLRIVLDTKGRIPHTAKLLHASLPGRTIIATSSRIRADTLTMLDDHNIECWVLPEVNGKVSLTALLNRLHKENCLSCLVEGGSTLLGAFFDAGLVDEVHAFLNPSILGGTGLSPINGEGVVTLAKRWALASPKVTTLDGDIYISGRLHMEASV